MADQAHARGFLLELAAEGIAPVIGGCAGVIVAGPAGAAGGAVVGRVVEKAINYFGPKIVERWLDWFRRQPRNVQIEAVAGLGSVPAEEARQVAKVALDRLAPSISTEDKSLALEYIAAIPEVVQQSLLLDLSTGGVTIPPSLSLVSPQSLMQLLPTDAPPYAAPMTIKLPDMEVHLKRVIGIGGFGVVYEAVMPALQDLPLAIKFCLDPSMVDMLKREHDNLRTLKTSGGKENWSTKIVRLYGYKLDHATPFLVYEYVRGGTLTSYLARRRAEIGGNLSPAKVLGLIVQITEALDFAHARGLVHRDLKPANVLVDGETLKLADFGIGGIMAGHAAAHSQIGRSMVDKLHADEQVSLLRGSGSPLYMDPDQRRGGDANAKHDLYCLVVVWYQLLVGDVTRELHGGWDDELESEFGVPRNHIDLMKKCVRVMKNRLANAGELLKLLQGLTTSESLLPRPPTPDRLGPVQPRTSPGDGTIILPAEFGFESCSFKVREGKTTSFRVEAVDCVAAATEFALRRLLGLKNPSQIERRTLRALLNSDATEAARVLSAIEDFARAECELSGGPRFGDGEKKLARLGSWSFCFSYDCAWVGGRPGLQNLRGRHGAASGTLTAAQPDFDSASLAEKLKAQMKPPSPQSEGKSRGELN